MDFQCVFWNGRTEKHQTSTARFRLAEENGQHRPFPSLACVLPHPLQNRVPRGERAPVALCCEPTEAAAETSPSHEFLLASGLFYPFAPVLNRSHLLQHPKRTRFRPFWPKPGAFFSFSLFSGCKIFVLVFVHPAA